MGGGRTQLTRSKYKFKGGVFFYFVLYFKIGGTRSFP